MSSIGNRSRRLSPRQRIFLATCILFAWAAWLTTSVALTVANWR